MTRLVVSALCRCLYTGNRNGWSNMGNKNTTGKHAAMSQDAIIEAASVGHNAALDSADTSPVEVDEVSPLVASLARGVDIAALVLSGEKTTRNEVKRALLAASVAGVTQDEVRAMLQASPAWPVKDMGNKIVKIGERQARTLCAPAHFWNSLLSNGYNRFVIVEGLAVISKGESGEDCLTVKSKAAKAKTEDVVPFNHETGIRTEGGAVPSPEQEVLKAAELLRDKISPEQLDMIRGSQDIFGALVAILTGQKLAA